MKSRLHLIAVLLFIGIAGFIFLFLVKKDSENQTVVEVGEEKVSKTSGVNLKSEKRTSSDFISSEGAVKPKSKIYVHVCGEVKKEGVYKIKNDGRVVDAIRAAGGVTKNAATYGINQAELLKDGMQVYVPSKKEIKNLPGSVNLENQNGKSIGTTGFQSSNSLININSASKEELMTLKGVGESRAALIIEYREQSGGFKDIKDIMKIKGIKQKFFDKIKDKISV